MYLAYYNTSYDIYNQTSGWTNCSTDDVLKLYDNGYFMAACRNAGSVGWHAYCNSWNYTP